MRRRGILPAALLGAAGIWVQPAIAQAEAIAQGEAAAQAETVTQIPETPLAPFERLMDGQWQLDETVQEFEWGVGKLSVKSRSYILVDGELILSAEGMWFWHPGKERIEGLFTAVNMPVVVFEYTTRFEENKMVNELRTYDAQGSETVYQETWEFTDDDHYDWKLFQETSEGLQELMGGTFERRGSGS